MEFNIDEYLNSLPDATTSIHVLNRNLTYLPDLSRFYKLEELRCNNNQLTKLPELNATLKRLYCCNNKLTELPPLNNKLETLYCNNNRLTSLPSLNERLETFCFVQTPIYNLIMDIRNDIHKTNLVPSTKKKIQTLYQFKHLFYSLKFKSKFRQWLWVKVREPKIQEYYSPANLVKLLSGIDEDDEEQFEITLNNW